MRRLLPMALLAAAVFGTDAEAAVRVYRPTEPSQVVLQLGSSVGESQLAQLRAASGAAPSDVAATLRYVDALMEAGAQSGNERYYGYAEQVLRGANASGNTSLALRRAQLLQHQHDFAAAERVLGEIIEINGRDREALLMRAQVRLHLHEPQEALTDCTALMPLTDLLTSTTCVAQARAALGDLRRAQTLLLRVLEFQPGGDEATRSWAAGVAAEFAARRGDVSAAERWYREAFELHPDSHYARITYADWLLSAGRFDRALQVAGQGASLADRARTVLAARDTATLDAQRLQLAWQEAAARGERAHLRDRARFELMLLRDPAKANATARTNFQNQSEADDALLLAETAAASGDQQSLRVVREWQQRHRYEDVRLEALLGALQ
jgi:Tfp pilus assembly protein PilF